MDKYDVLLIFKYLNEIFKKRDKIGNVYRHAKKDYLLRLYYAERMKASTRIKARKNEKLQIQNAETA